jgi:hypothetical protein
LSCLPPQGKPHGLRHRDHSPVKCLAGTGRYQTRFSKASHTPPAISTAPDSRLTNAGVRRVSQRSIMKKCKPDEGFPLPTSFAKPAQQAQRHSRERRE